MRGQNVVAVMTRLNPIIRGCGQLLPHRGVEEGLCAARQLDVRPGSPLGEKDASAQALVLVETEILGSAQPEAARRWVFGLAERGPGKSLLKLCWTTIVRQSS